MSSLQGEIALLRKLARPVVLDPPKVHSAFVPKADGTIMHGQKRDWGKIKRGSSLYSLWRDTTAQYIHETYGPIGILLGIANGTNTFAADVSETLNENYDQQTTALATIKLPNGIVVLGEETETALEAVSPGTDFLELDDEGTSGTTTLRVAMRLRELGFTNVQVLYTSQRQETLKFLDEAEPPVPNQAMIHDPLPTFTAEECNRLPQGMCRQQWQLNPYGS